MGHTYGTWLPGDPRSFRTRHHREHIVGDYKNPPPPGMYERRHAKAKSLMTRPAVFLTDEQRAAAVDEFSQSLVKREIELVVLSIDRIHFHLLARFADHDPRHWVGIAKKESSHYLKERGLGPAGGLWATRCQCLPVADQGHQLRVVDYIIKHKHAGAVVWFFKDHPKG